MIAHMNTKKKEKENQGSQQIMLEKGKKHIT